MNQRVKKILGSTMVISTYIALLFFLWSHIHETILFWFYSVGPMVGLLVIATFRLVVDGFLIEPTKDDN